MTSRRPPRCRKAFICYTSTDTPSGTTGFVSRCRRLHIHYVSVHSVHTKYMQTHFKCRSERVPETKLPACVSRISAPPMCRPWPLRCVRSTYSKRLRTRFGGRGVGAGRTREARLGSISKWLSGDTCRGGRICFLVHCIAFGGWAGWLASWPIRSFLFDARIGGNLPFIFCCVL